MEPAFSFILLCPSPMIVPALLLGLALRPSRAPALPLRSAAAEAFWARVRWWTLAPSFALVALALIVLALDPDWSPAAHLLMWWYALPGLAFIPSFLPYFHCERLVDGSTSPDFARLFNRFAIANGLLLASCTCFFLAATGSFLREGILLLIGIVPATFVSALGVMLFLLIDPAAGPIARPGALVDRLLQSKRLTGALFLIAYTLRKFGVGSVPSSEVGLTHVVATSLSLVVFATVFGARFRPRRDRHRRAVYPTFVSAIAGLSAFNALLEIWSVGWALLSRAA